MTYRPTPTRFVSMVVERRKANGLFDALAPRQTEAIISIRQSTRDLLNRSDLRNA